MAMYYYACRLTAACSSPAPQIHKVAPPPFKQYKSVATISHQPGPSRSSDKVSLLPVASQQYVRHHHHHHHHHNSHRHQHQHDDHGNGSSVGEESALPTDVFVESLTSESLVHCDDNLVSGRLDALVGNIVPTADYYPDRAFIFAFLLASRLFIKPHDLLGQIFAKCQAEMTNLNKGTEPNPHLVRLISEWTETFPYDFRDERVMCHVRKLAHSCVSAGGNNFGAVEIREEISLVLHTLLEKLTKLEQYEAFLHSIRTSSLTSDAQTLNPTETDELCGSAESLAQQLTHIELERLSYIGAEEFLQTFIIKTPMIESSHKDPRITSNYEVYAEWSSRLQRLVVTDIVRHNKSKKQRVRIVEYWVDTAKECFNIGNFNSLVAIIAGLNTVSISRLKRTWSRSEVTEQFTILDTQMSSSENYASYRTLLRAAGARFNKDDRRLCIVIPIFTLLAEEINDLCEQCLKKLPNGHINFEKFWQLAKQMTEFITWKQVQCPFPKTAKVITYLQATPVLNDDGALLASFSCEPPQDDQEKEVYEELISKLGSQKPN